MRRLVALLLALLIAFPCAAMAADHSLTVNWYADEARMAEYFARVGFPEDDASTLAKSITALMNVLSARAAWQEDLSGAYAAICLEGEEIVSFDCQQTEQGVLLGSNLMPGAAIALDAQLLEELQTEWQEGILTMLLGLMEHLRIQEEYGTFVGDAYEGGVRCETVTANLDSLAPGWHILARLVYDAENDPRGISLTLLDADEAQLMTLSIGLSQKDLKAVLGFGMEGRTWFVDVVFTKSTEYELCADVTLYQDWQGMGYAALVNDPDAVWSTVAVDMTFFNTEDGLLWYGELDTQTKRGPVRIVLTGTLDPAAQQLNEQEAVYIDDDIAFSSSVATVDAETVWPDHAGDMVVQFAELEKNEALPDIVEQGMNQLALKLIRMMPIDTMLLLFQ